MDYDDFRNRLNHQLARVFSQQPYGTMKRVTDAMGVSANYFQEWKRSNISMPRLLEVLEILGVEPFDFFAQAMRPDDIYADEIDQLIARRDAPQYRAKHLDIALQPMRQRGEPIEPLEALLAEMKEREQREDH